MWFEGVKKLTPCYYTRGWISFSFGRKAATHTQQAIRLALDNV